MANFIEEFYYGNLDPQARSTKENKAVQKHGGVDAKRGLFNRTSFGRKQKEIPRLLQRLGRS